MPLAPNQKLYEYRIVRMLGQGSFGAVYLAHDTLLDRPVAIKELVVTPQTDEQAFKRFLQEARTAGGLNHPNVVTVYALKVEGPKVYLVMEHVGGGSLRSLLDKRGKLDIEQAVKIAIDVCEGLAAVHAKGIVHRDIKPENILLTEDGRAKVSDFGIAHVPRGAGGTSLTQAGFQPGTLVYMSPEQVLGKPVDARSDVYQVGELLYEMLAGRHYIDLAEIERQARDSTGNNALRMQAKVFDLLADAVCAKLPIALERLRPEVPGELKRITELTLAKQVDMRPKLAELAEMLRHCSGTQVVLSEYMESADKELARQHFELGMQFKAQEQLEQAIAELEQAVVMWPEYSEAYYELGEVFLIRQENDKAQKAYAQALDANPSFASAWIRLAELYGRQGASAAAAEALQYAIQVEPYSVRCHYYWDLMGELFAGGTLRTLYSEVFSAYQEALAVSPGSAEIHYNLGRILEMAGGDSTPDQAITEYQQALSLKPNYPQALVAIGNVYLEMDQPKSALPMFQRAAGMEWPEEAPSEILYGTLDSLGQSDAYLGLVRVYLKLERFDHASAIAQLAVDMCRSAENAYGILWQVCEAYQGQAGDCAIKRGRLDLAVTLLQAAAGMFPLIRQKADDWFKSCPVPGDRRNNIYRAISDEWAQTSHFLSLLYYRWGLQSLDKGARDEAIRLLDKALEAWKAGYSILPDDKKTGNWNDTLAKIESARKRVTNK